MADIARILGESNTIAVVGLSDRPERASRRVAAYMQDAGYRIFPVNPRLTEPVLGEQPYPNLRSVPGPVDVVNIFRRPRDVASAVDEAIDIGARTVWMQLGIVDQPAAERALASGLDVVMDRCIMVEHRRWASTKFPSNTRDR